MLSKGLDPATMIVDFYPREYRLTTNSADYVHALHTSSGTGGEFSPTGHVDFIINGGIIQPICMKQINIPGKLQITLFKTLIL